MKRLLITGATGFLGVPCVLRASDEFEVHATARREFHTNSAIFHQCDLFDETQVNALLTAVRPTHLLHLAWIATPGVYWTSPENQTWVTVSKHLLRAFQESGGQRAVIAGTCAEYDWTADGVDSMSGVCDEARTPARPATLYGQCKNELRVWATACGLDIAWARLFYLYGPREHPARLVPSVAKALLAGSEALCSEGSQERDFLHTEDLADAMITLLQSKVSGLVNVGSGVAARVRTVVEAVARECGRSDLLRMGARPLPSTEPPRLIANITRLRNDVGWRPRIGLEDGLRQTVDWWRAYRAA